MPVESTLSTKELRKTWTGKSSRAKATTRKPKKARADPKIPAPKVAPPQVNTVVTLFFKAYACCTPGAKRHLCCSHPAKVSHSQRVSGGVLSIGQETMGW